MRRRTCHVLRQQKKPLSSISCGLPLPPPSSFPVLKNSGRATATAVRSSFPQHDPCNNCSRRRSSGSSATSRSITSSSSSRKRFLSTSPPTPTSTPPPPPPRRCRVYNITGGTVPYEQAWLWQQRLLHERMAWQREERKAAPNPHTTDSHDVLLLLEHPPVYTLGRGSSLDHLRFDPTDASSSCGREVRRTERGGEVTWHGPGQIVGYPVLDLNFHKKDLHWYLRQLEEVIIRVLGRYGLEGERETEHTGVWVGGAKVAAIGLNASRWVTSHGFSVNVNPDLRAFDAIVPCGIQGRPVARLCDLIGAETIASPPLFDEFEIEIAAAAAEGKGSGADVSAAEEEAAAAAVAGAAEAIDAGSVRSLVVQEFKAVFGVEMEIVDVDASAAAAEANGDDSGGDDLERQIFSTECEPKLRERLRADSRRQLELTKR